LERVYLNRFLEKRRTRKKRREEKSREEEKTLGKKNAAADSGINLR
jgi:hypothetical protein